MIMTRGELLEMLTKFAKAYRKDTTSVSRNQHLTFIDKEPDQATKDAILVDFINYVGVRQCLDYALNVDDLKKEEE